jgi:hypothetical protein
LVDQLDYFDSREKSTPLLTHVFESSWPVSNQLRTSIKGEKKLFVLSQCPFQVKADYSQIPLMSALPFMRSDSRGVLL